MAKQKTEKNDKTDKTDNTTDERIKGAGYVFRSATGVDEEKTVEAFRKAVQEYASEDVKKQEGVMAALQKLLDPACPQTKDMTHLKPGTIARLAVFSMGITPDDATCDDAEVRIRSFLKSNDDYLWINNGRNAGAHIKAKLSEEELAKLVKSDAS